MSIRTILAITDLETALTNIDKAVSIARACKAHLTVLAVGEVPHLPFYGYGGHGYVEIWARECDKRKTALTSVAEDLENRLAGEDISFDVRPGLAAIAREDDLVARHAIYCDLALVLRSGELELSLVEKNAIDGALFDSGRPVLYIPKTFENGRIGTRVAIAWNARPEAARAISDALPFLMETKDITLLVVDPVVGDDDHGEDPGSDIALVLARHGLKVTVQNVASTGRTVSETLLDTCREHGTDLLVMGAYGHSRLRENILGGTTREMLERSPVPLLLSR
ncbi:universal stress protein [Roseibium sediminicola]|uniref:Universal stress protein n=1 Tax=Roseibium sediminicola TaxID=2933272 RepID=A0ABT0GRX3_9HYPH|nr:universal stress protein [Roseibium sp. CAU 1639]MCK7611802.1 universal stress protein [Roseibium sp. CAU 1639]